LGLRHFSPRKKQHQKTIGGTAMRITCEIIKDLLPLYAEGLASADTAALVAEHISSCAGCKNELGKISSAAPVPFDADVAPLKKIRATLRKQRAVTILLSVFIALIVAVTVFGFLTSPVYIPYTNDVVAVSGMGDGSIQVQFGDGVSGYDVKKSFSEDGGLRYHITAWDSIWNQWFKKNGPSAIVLNMNESNDITRVYYYQASDDEDVLIYGQPLSGGIVTLPRLALNYYFIIALLLAVISGLAIILKRKNKVIQGVMINFLFIPVAYIAAHLCIKGAIATSYSAQRDLFLIILLALPVYGFLYFLFNRRRFIRGKSE
jgi:hypothetical protein